MVKSDMKDRILAWFQTYGDRCLIFIGFVLVGGLCFEAGILQGKVGRDVPVTFSVASALPASVATTSEHITPVSNHILAQDGLESTAQSLHVSGNILSNCPFVGSKNSTKYHLSTCAVAKRIKPENRVCFSSQEEAQKRGYVPSCLK